MESKSVSSPTFSVNPIVTLNIGGTKYTTHAQTLISNPNTLFKSLVNTLPKDRDGNIFVDRDPFYFRYILDSLRQGEIQHPFLSGTYDCIRYWKEIDFFRLLAPGHIWGFSRKRRSKHTSIAVSEDTFLAQKIGSSKSAFSSVCCNKALEHGRFRWRVITEGVAGGIAFGIVHSNSYKADKLNINDIYGLSTQSHLYNLEKYAGDDEDEDEDEEGEGDKKEPLSLMKPEDELGKRVILAESDDEEGENPEEGKENDDLSSDEGSGDESGDALKSKKIKNEEGKQMKGVKKEETFMVEYDGNDGTMKVYKQNEETWYVGKIIDKKEGYYFFASLKNVGDKVRIELLQ